MRHGLSTGGSMLTLYQKMEHITLAALVRAPPGGRPDYLDEQESAWENETALVPIDLVTLPCREFVVDWYDALVLELL